MGILLKPKPTKQRRMTTREYMTIPPSKQHETLLLYGKFIVTPRNGPTHNHLMYHLAQMLNRWIRGGKLGEMFVNCDLILSEVDDLVHAPDVMFLATENADHYRDEKIYGPVDLAIDVLSPWELPYLQYRKFADYECYSIRWHWSIDLNAKQPTLEEHQLVSGRYECRSEVAGDEWFEPGLFPGLVFRLPQLLAGDLKAAVKGKAKKLM